ncbi:hypothetical protein [Algoriphagus boritolerans]|uniref:hypothetical protein n=1 Tax=Algoriphagus boritolerans TaxID=308111 RepID=UPI000AC97970
MSKIPVTAVFDIGKTNKKFFLFDENLKEVFNTYTRLDAIPDEDGFPSEPVLPLREWMLKTFKEALSSPDFDIKNSTSPDMELLLSRLTMQENQSRHCMTT